MQRATIVDQQHGRNCVLSLAGAADLNGAVQHDLAVARAPCQHQHRPPVIEQSHRGLGVVAPQRSQLSGGLSKSRIGLLVSAGVAIRFRRIHQQLRPGKRGACRKISQRFLGGCGARDCLLRVAALAGNFCSTKEAEEAIGGEARLIARLVKPFLRQLFGAGMLTRQSDGAGQRARSALETVGWETWASRAISLSEIGFRIACRNTALPGGIEFRDRLTAHVCICQLATTSTRTVFIIVMNR